eukprot:4147331-Pyramimonas_sp.AAC.1
MPSGSPWKRWELTLGHRIRLQTGESSADPDIPSLRKQKRLDTIAHLRGAHNGLAPISAHRSQHTDPSTPRQYTDTSQHTQARSVEITQRKITM